MLRPICAIAQFMNWAPLIPFHELCNRFAQHMNWARKYCSVHELCSACARKKYFHAPLLEFLKKHSNVVNTEFWSCHITNFCFECLFLCSEIH